MSNTTTHYTTLGLVPTAAPEIIRASYKALALISHPDKTVHLAAGERASHAAVFQKVQAAYDVLGNPSLKTAYDADLARRASKADKSQLPSRAPAQARPNSEASSTPKRRPSVKLTTPEERTAMRAKARQSLESLRQKRAEHDAQDARLDIAGLKDMVHTWKQLAEENVADPAMRAHCVIRIHEYETKITERERQHEEWLANMSTAKQGTSKPTSRSWQPAQDSQKSISQPAKASARPAPTSQSKAPQTSRQAKHSEIEAERAAAAAQAAERMEARLAEKARRDAAKQALLNQKTAAVRAQKDERQAVIDLQAQIYADHIAKARSKAGAAPKGTVGASVGNHYNGDASVTPSFMDRTARKVVQTHAKVCDKCGAEHANFRDWRVCNAQMAPVDDDADGVDDGSFFRAV